MGFPLRKLLGRIAMIAFMLVGGVVVGGLPTGSTAASQPSDGTPPSEPASLQTR